MSEPAKHDPSTSANETEFLPSFVDLYHECLTPMVRLAWALTGSEVVAEDVVHDAFLRVHAHWSRIENPRPYLRRERTLENVALIDAAHLDADELFDALATLPYRQRAALVLQFYERLPQSEIAQVLRCREGTVASLVHRGLAQLRRVIER